MTTRPGMREGFALPAALLALIVVGGLVTAGAYAAMTEDRSSLNADFGQKAFTAAERGLQDVLGTKTRPYFEEEVGGVGEEDIIGPVAITVGEVDAQYTVSVKRLATRLFLVESEGEVLTGGKYAGATRRLARLMRIHYTYLPNDRAYTTQADVRIRGQSFITGDDSHPTGWTECTQLATQTGVVTNDESTIDVPPGGGGNTGVMGDPPSREDAALDSLSFIQYGDMHLDDLKAYANITLPAGTYSSVGPEFDDDGRCDSRVETNWGDPFDTSSACHTYWPIIHVTGDMTLNGGGIGQGILIVDGTLSISGGFEFSGIVFIYGQIKASGTGNKIMGSVNILGSSGYSEIGMTGAGNTEISLSSCAIERAHRYNDRFARPIILAERSFVDLSGIGVQ